MNPFENLANQRFSEFVQSSAEASAEILKARLEACDTPAAAAQVLGIDESMFEGADEETTSSLVAMTVAFREVGNMMASGHAVSLDSDQMESIGANAKTPHTILVRRDAERVLTDFFEQGNPELAKTFFSTPGSAESVVPDSQSITLHYFSDGSMLARIESLSKPNIHLRQHMLAQARTVGDAMSKEDAAELLGALQSVASQLTESLDLPPHVVAHMPTLVEEQALDFLRALTTAAQNAICAPLSDDSALINMFQKHATADGLAWKSGLSVEVDGKDCPTPASFKTSLGIGEQTTLDGALERLRTSRKASTSPDNNSTTKNNKKPK